VRGPGHPSTRKLHRWVHGDDISLDKHLATCTACADRLEQSFGENDSAIRATLVQLLAVPDELPERLEAGMAQHAEVWQGLTLVGEFFGLPLQTARVMTSTDQGDD